MLLGLVASVLASQVVGFIYYSPRVLGSMWMQAQFPGRPASQIKENAEVYITSILSYATLAILLQFIFGTYKVTGLVEGVQVGLGLAALSMLMHIPHVMFGQTSFALLLINQFYDFIVAAAMSACLVYF